MAKKKQKKTTTANRGATQGTVRVTLDLTDNANERLNLLSQGTSLSKAMVLRQALQLYEFVIKATMQGSRFRKIDGDGTESDVTLIGLH
jgi:hypothetical protein